MKTFNIRNFKNPVTPSAKSGFSAISTDSLGYAIGESDDLTLPAVTDPTTFSNVAFIFDDTNSVGQYSTFRISLAMLTSLDYRCYVKIEFPDDFLTDYQLINV